MRSHGKRRRGVLLLVVLGLLAMFAMIGLTFVMLTGQARRIAEVGRSMDVQYVPPRDDLDRAMAQVARGSTSPMSAIGPHSLLEDLYGTYSKSGRLTSINEVYLMPGNNGPMLELAVTGVTSPEQCGGCVLTMLNGPAAGTSVRILAYLPASFGRRARFQVLPTESLNYDQLNTYFRSAGANQINYTINGAEFSGRGLGTCNVTTGVQSDDALQPGLHRVRGYGVLQGEANEDYDAPDHQNMLLALVKGPIFPGLQGAASTNEDTIRVPIPSLHRPDLIQYWVSRGAASPTDVPNYVLRPLQSTPDAKTPIHRSFTGSNPNFYARWNGTYTDGGGRYSWDVDNDGDGVADSVWVDLGMQVRSTTDGRLYKPLFAILCTDLDGRLNLNAHGCIAQLNGGQDGYYTTTRSAAAWGWNGQLSRLWMPQKFAWNDPNNPGTGTLAVALPHGMGYGPAEINLRTLFDSTYTAGSASIPPELGYLMRGRNLGTQGSFEGRYGETVGNAAAGMLGVRTPFTYMLFNRNYSYLNLFNGAAYWNPSFFDAYGTPPDWDGLCAVGLDVGGRPIWWGMGESTAYAVNTPYELNLARDSAWRTNATPWRSVDNPFTPAELERVLRLYDIDSASLPSRLLALTSDTSGNLASSPLLRHSADITTESWDHPCPPVVMPPELRMQGNYNGAALHFLYVLQRKLAQNSVGLSGDPLVVRARQLLPPEMLSGLKMDLNRPFGNGRDDNRNQVVDEAEEAEPGDYILPYNAAGQTARSVQLDMSNGMQLDPNRKTPHDRMNARQFYARNLYVLALLVCDYRAFEAVAGTPGTGGLTPRMKRQLAQWAVNVVDFFDRDSIMTRFDYDCNPWDGWTPPGNNQDLTKGGFVYGCERPELLLTETLAFHDRRTEDLNSEIPNPGEQPAKTDDPTNPDADYDQHYRPEGSLFIELYNPWSRYDAPTGEIHTLKNLGTGNSVPAVDLARRTPPQTAVQGQPAPRQDPVWQLLVVKPTQTNDPFYLDNPDDEDPDISLHEAERAIYFTDPGELPHMADGFAKVRYYCSTNKQGNNVETIGAGEYAVIGPGRDEATESITRIGFPLGNSPDMGVARRIVLRFGVDTAKQNRVEVLNNNLDLPSTQTTIQPPVAIIVDRSSPKARHDGYQRMSVSEPVGKTADEPGGYEQDNLATFVASDQAYMYSTTFDTPVDLTRTDTDLREAVTARAMTPCIRVLHLRRLANPLKPFDGRLKINVNFNPDYNPYRTVDSIPIDLTSFNGTAPWSEKEFPGVAKFEELDTRERGEHQPVGVVDPNNVWRQEPWLSTDGDLFPVTANMKLPPPPENQNYNRSFTHTLGYLNSWYGELPPRIKKEDEIHRGDPTRPFPWLVWNNRPFVSHYELLLVPGAITRANNATPCSSDRLLNYAEFGPATQTGNHYNPAANKLTYPFKQLQNYFESLPFPSTATTAAETRPIQLHRILEYVCVPSRFVCSQIQLDPTLMATYTAEHYFHPPYNWVSAFREPGRVNINTIYSYDVFRGVMNNTAMPESEMLSLWDRVVRSRRADNRAAITLQGTTTAGKNQFLTDVMRYSMLQINAALPTRFGNPFRSYAGGSLRHSTLRDAMRTSKNQEAEIHTTFLRGDPDVTTRPLFRYQTNATQYYDNTLPNEYFRYQHYQRLANMLTTRSNVYAVWITVGYFEVRRNTSNTTIFPDSWELGAELGIDSGEVQRHRAFYIFDRSIPVGFVRGQDLNYEKALLIRRYIE